MLRPVSQVGWLLVSRYSVWSLGPLQPWPQAVGGSAASLLRLEGLHFVGSLTGKQQPRLVFAWELLPLGPETGGSGGPAQDSGGPHDQVAISGSLQEGRGRASQCVLTSACSAEPVTIQLP